MDIINNRIKNNGPEIDSRFFILLIEYDGSEFSGWQVQPGYRTVQGEIESALRNLMQEQIRIIGAGRTDAGVHALGQVASFHSMSSLYPLQIQKGLNGLMPEDIRILDVKECDRTFNARSNATGRAYRYILSKRLNSIGRQYSWYPRTNFSVTQMETASKYLIGEHDFTSFCKGSGYNGSCVSCVKEIKWEKEDEKVLFNITAIRFFHNMIRVIIGTLIEVGRGKISPDEFLKILKAKDRRLAGPTAPPQGLFLVKVHFDNNILAG